MRLLTTFSRLPQKEHCRSRRSLFCRDSQNTRMAPAATDVYNYCTPPQQNRGILPRLPIQLKRVIHLRRQGLRGEPKGKASALAGLTVHADRPSIIFDEAFDIRQPEPRSILFGRKERLEDSGYIRVRDTAARIGDFDRD